MADGSNIGWTDATWNPTVGCTRVSPGCDHCYSVKLSHRLEKMGQAKYSGLTSLNQKGERHFNGVVRCCEDELLKPMGWKKGRRIFVNSMSDLFHKEVPFDFVDKVFAVMALCPQHTFQVLTKRPDRMAEYLAPGRDALIKRWRHEADPNRRPTSVPASAYGSRAWTTLAYDGTGGYARVVWPLSNVELGTSCEDQTQADRRVLPLLQCPAAVHFLSCEPLLGLLTLTKIAETATGKGSRKWVDALRGDACIEENGNTSVYAGAPHGAIDWVIVGGESGAGARPFAVQWAKDILGQCRDAHVPFFMKQMGANPRDAFTGRAIRIHDKHGSVWDDYEDLKVREFPGGALENSLGPTSTNPLAASGVGSRQGGAR